MAEAELVVHKKKKKKKNKIHLTEELPEPSSTHQTTYEEIRVHKKHEKKKKKAKENENNDSRPAEVHGDAAEGKIKKKRKREGEKVNVTPVVMGESVDSSSQKREVPKKRKKTRIEETEHPVGDREAEVTPVQTNSEAAHQKPTKSKSKKPRKSAGSQDTAQASSATDTQLHPDEMQSKGLALNIDEAILQEIREYLPHCNFTNKHLMYKIILYDLPRFREFKKQGIPLRTGRFTVAENKRLKQNVRDFLALSGIDSEAKIFMPHRFPEERKAITRLKRNLGFFTWLSAGIPRPSENVYQRAKNFCNQENYMGRFTDVENKTLLELHKLHGSEWTTISDKMGRSASAVKCRFAMFSEVHGPWTEAEVRTLLTSMRQQLLKRATPGEDGSIGSAVIRKVDLYKRLPWMSVVSKQVQTRSWLQCKIKWMRYLASKMRTGGAIKGRKNLEGQIQLIKAINEMVVEDAADIVWDDLTHLFGNTHPDHLHMRFYQLKVTHVPGWNRMMDFCDVIDYLYEKTLPKLEEELRNCKEDEEPTEERDSYKLSEIFPDL